MATILILDDDTQVRGSLVINLEDEGYDILEAATAEAALELLAENRADLAVVDLRLPDMDGPDFINIAGERWPELRFIVYTGSPRHDIPDSLTQSAVAPVRIFFKPLADYGPLNDEIARLVNTP